MTSRMLLLSLTIAAALTSGRAAAQFTGDLAFTNAPGCEAERRCVLANALRFIDPAGRIWQADAGDETDGASIPSWAQIAIGRPYDESYLKAAIVHDHYCDRRVSSWRDTHLMFYHALRALGVSEFKSKVMYYAVYLGGPKWIDVMAHRNCAERPGEVCINSQTMVVVDTIVRPERFADIEMNKEMTAFENYMTQNPGVTLEQIETIALQKYPDDAFYNRGDAVVSGAGVADMPK